MCFIHMLNGKQKKQFPASSTQIVIVNASDLMVVNVTVELLEFVFGFDLSSTGFLFLCTKEEFTFNRPPNTGLFKASELGTRFKTTEAFVIRMNVTSTLGGGEFDKAVRQHQLATAEPMGTALLNL